MIDPQKKKFRTKEDWEEDPDEDEEFVDDKMIDSQKRQDERKGSVVITK